MSKEPLKVGDRVRVYGFFLNGGYFGQKGTVKERHGAGFRVQIDGGSEMSAHPKQCRRLRPKKVEVRKRVERWLAEYSGGLAMGLTESVFKHQSEAGAFKAQLYPKCVIVRHFVEKLPGEVLVDREKLAKAFWDGKKEVSKKLPPGSFPLPADVLDEIAKCLGLPAKGAQEGR